MSNFNFLSPLGFQFVLTNSPNTQRLIQSVTVPGMNLGSTITPTPFTRIVNPGNISYGDLSVTMKIDEEMEAYDEIFDWMERLGHPDSFEQYQNERVDARLLVLGSNKRPIRDFTFTDVYPNSISELQFDVTLSDVQYFTFNVTFAFNRMYRNRLTDSA